MRMNRVFGVLAALLSVALIGFVVGCGSDDGDSSSTAASSTSTAAAGGGGTTDVGLTEYKFDPNDLEVTAGDTIALSNDGKIPHNFTIVEGSDPTGRRRRAGGERRHLARRQRPI